MTQGVSKRKDLMKISKVIFHIKPIPSQPWWESKNVQFNATKIEIVWTSTENYAYW